MNLIDCNVDMHVVRIVVDHAYALGLAASLGTFLEPHHSQAMKSNCKLSDKLLQISIIGVRHHLREDVLQLCSRAEGRG